MKTNRTKRKPDEIEFSRRQRAWSNSFEQTLWKFLRGRQRCGMKFRRQHAIGPYTVDFYCAEANLIVEVDGTEHWTEEGKTHDQQRDRYMKRMGLRVLRLSGYQVENDTITALNQIDEVLRPLTPCPSPHANTDPQLHSET